jgi:3-deoxy-D-manno-octulosonic-acid transferase
MKKLWFTFYNVIVVPVLYLGVKIAGLYNPKVRRGIEGRERIFEELIVNSAAIQKSNKLVWFHSSSLGEFEQAKPIIEELKKNKEINILVTFFSPSGYDNSRKYPFADLVSYLPFDTKANAAKFIMIAKPNLAVLMRYDLWPNHIWAMRSFNIPIFLVDATMKKTSRRKFSFLKNFHKYLFRDLTKILTVSQSDADEFKDFGCTDKQVKAVGDTRFDRVYQRSITARSRNLLKIDLFKGKKILVAGSTWEADEDVILPAFSRLARYDSNVILIIAPHEPTVINLEKIENEFSGDLATIRFSSMNNYNGERVIIIDSIGILLTLYTYADAAFVGGSFKQNIHNVLEAAVYGIPVLFGPKIDNSQETKELLKLGGGILIRNKKEAYRNLRMLFSNDVLRKEKGAISYNYVQKNLGATEKILREINQAI